MAVFLSPSGDGLKVLVPIIGEFAGAFRAVAEHFARLGMEIDEARKDQTGLCFASHDPSLWVAADPDSCEPFRPSECAIIPRYQNTDGDIVTDFASVQAATEPLMMISPDCPYSQWIEIGQALHCQFAGSFDGLSLWDQWSRHGEKYEGEKSLQKHYHSFRSAGITFRTVLKYAANAGWSRPGRPKARVQQARPASTANELGELIDAQVSGTYSAVPFPFPIVTKATRALLPGSVTLLCGAPGSAKSWFVLQCLRYWVASGYPAAVLMLEEGRGWHLNRLLAQLTREKNVLDPDWVRANGEEVHRWYASHRSTIDSVGASLHCDGNVTMAACCDWVEQQCSDGKRIIVVDPITLADPGAQKSWDADRQMIARCKVAIEKAGASLILVTHPRKGSGSGAGGKPAPPGMDDLSGGAAYSRAAACVIWMNGLPDGEITTVVDHDGNVREHEVHKHVRVLKARNSKGLFASIGMAFSELCLTEVGTIVAKPAKPADASHQSPRLRQKPCTSEDLFHEAVKAG